MGKKIIFIGLSLLFTLTTISTAQRSAQSVMSVTAKVVKGATVTHYEPTSVNMQMLYDSGIKTLIGAISVRNSLYSQIAVTPGSRIRFINNRGSQIDMDITVERNGTDGNGRYTYNGTLNRPDKIEGIYYGEHETLIEYN